MSLPSLDSVIHNNVTARGSKDKIRSDKEYEEENDRKRK